MFRRPGRTIRSGRLLLGFVSVIIALLLVTPVVYLVVRVMEIGADDALAYLFRPRTGQLLWRTAQLAVLVTSASIVIGVGAAWCVTRGVRRGRAVVVALLTAPLAIPSYVSGFVWTRLFPGFEGLWAAVLVLTLACYPLVMLPAMAALAGTGGREEDAARTLGCSAPTAFLRVTLPRIRTAVLAGGLLVALYSISDFGGPAIVRFEPFTVGIYNAYNGTLDRSVAALYGLVLATIAVFLALAERRVRRDVDSGATPPRSRDARDRPVAWTLVTLTVSVGVCVPIVGLLTEIRESRRLGFDDFGELLAWVAPYTRTTLELSAQAAVVIAILALPLAFFISRPRTRTGDSVELVSYLGYTLPGVTVALSMVFLGTRVLPSYYLTAGMLIATYVVLFLPVCLGPVRSGVDAIPLHVADVSRTLGAGPLATAVRVQLPLLMPAVLAGSALAFLSVAKELPATLMLAPIGTRTLATDMWSLSNDLNHGRAAVLGLVLIIVASIPTAALSTLFGKGVDR
ncbi:iron ABC transporter permease [Gordonia alkanivorans]|uniref:ABC transporter permease n=1 Tax=Gordonia TaxID=2053 RepID=UPI00244878D7|nr:MULTISPECIES: iron ABC transporter permease [Gordonia]MDH3012201.1 iron ABC transporter permease [Gordonia alkanivorans]MDH3050104.1 iron ABC transporter permease [Gordonia alkanivorans]WJG13073.1 iron ABC transporter permease [Gordonia sp. Swx-4]